MQTFVPFPDVYECARVLDRLRLGKQRVEVLQLLKALGEGGGWSKHPAAAMWRGHERALAWYGLAICREWTLVRGYNDTCRGKIADLVCEHQWPVTGWPSWWGDDAVHASHRSNLLRKDPDWYGQFGWTEPHDLGYVWPTPDESPTILTPTQKELIS